MIFKLNYGSIVSRETLAQLTSTSDRTVRKCIELLRREGEPIGQAEGGGYTYGVKRDVDRTIRDYYAKALTNLEIARALEKKPIEGQVTVDDLMEF